MPTRRQLDQTLDERFDEKYTVAENGCWIWTATTNGHGYGCFSVNRKHIYAHRYAYIRYKGPIPDGLQLDHLCEVKSCVNPDHLEAVTRSQNIRRIAERRGTCERGHPWVPENLMRRGEGQTCRICNREWQRTRKKKYRYPYIHDPLKRLRRKHIEILCPFCGNKASVPEYGHIANQKKGNKTYCSMDCKNKSQERSHCVRGHEFTAENTVISKTGHRQCRTCGRLRSQAWYQENKHR